MKQRRIRWEGHVARKRKKRAFCSALVGNWEGKSPLGKPRRTFEDNIRINLKEIEGPGVA